MWHLQEFAFSLLNKTLDVPEKYSTFELSSAEIDFNSLPTLLKHPTAKIWWYSQKREGKSYFSLDKTWGSKPRPALHLCITLEVWILKGSRPEVVIAPGHARRTRWSHEQRGSVTTFILTSNSCESPAFTAGRSTITCQQACVVMRWQLCKSK